LLRFKALGYEAVNVLTSGLHSEDEKIMITTAVHILKTVGLYDGEMGKRSKSTKDSRRSGFLSVVEDKPLLQRIKTGLYH
jgi:hypothetical protein